LTSGDRKWREWAAVAQRITVAKADYRIVERGAAVEHFHPGILPEALLAIAADSGQREFVLRSVERAGL
jgi:hypothetical protein